IAASGESVLCARAVPVIAAARRPVVARRRTDRRTSAFGVQQEQAIVGDILLVFCIVVPFREHNSNRAFPAPPADRVSNYRGPPAAGTLAGGIRGASHSASGMVLHLPSNIAPT